MKIPLSWLSRYVEITLPVEELAQRLSMAGAEVERIERSGDGWEQVFVGRVLAVEPHPNADRLRLATVDIADGSPHTVVCGAPNVAAGQTVAFAVEGAVLLDADSGERRRLKRAKIRGVESAGMVCSERELGLSGEHEGILVLGTNAAPGTPLAEALGETMLEITPTPNRPDHMSVLGIAREVAALTGRQVREPAHAYPAEGPPVGERTSVTIEAPDLCPRYIGSVITGVTVGPSPPWMQEALLAAGMRPINNVVDVTNFVMLETGQPLHAFDFGKLSGERIVVRRAQEDEPITLLDGSQQKLTAEDLVIADAERPMAVAGIMGGVDSEVSPETTTILLESANFQRAANRRTAAALKRRTEASIRFEKGLNPELASVASERAMTLLLEACGGVADAGRADAYPGDAHQPAVHVTRGRMQQILGLDVPVDQVRSILESLGFGARWVPPDKYVVYAPYWRTDIAIADDVVEEVARIIGYDNLPTEALAGALPDPEPRGALDTREAVRDALAASGLAEAINYTTLGADDLANARVLAEENALPPLRLRNPMSAERDLLRTSLRPALLMTYAANARQARGGGHTSRLGFFEVGKVFAARDGDLPEERTQALALLGGAAPQSVHDSSAGEGRRIDFFDAKAVAEAVGAALGLPLVYVPPDDTLAGLSAGASATIRAGMQVVGVVGEVAAEVRAAFEIEGACYLLELDLATLEAARGEGVSVAALSRFPAVMEDLAIVVDAATPAARVAALLERQRLVERADLFDIYTGDQIEAGKKSLAYTLTYRAPDRTLTDKEVARARAGIVKQLERELGASIRAG